jgi:hypothetical protein
MLCARDSGDRNKGKAFTLPRGRGSVEPDQSEQAGDGRADHRRTALGHLENAIGSCADPSALEGSVAAAGVPAAAEPQRR